MDLSNYKKRVENMTVKWGLLDLQSANRYHLPLRNDSRNTRSENNFRFTC